MIDVCKGFCICRQVLYGKDNPSGKGDYGVEEPGIQGREVKHDAQRFEIDHPGKDSYRFTAAMPDTMFPSSPDKLALVKKNPAAPTIEELLDTYFTHEDIVLIEGFRKSSLPKIEIHRPELKAIIPT